MKGRSVVLCVEGHFMDLSSILEFIYVIVCVVLLFGAAVFVHEFGHFWVALKCGMKVEEFSIGFGRKIKSWKRNGIEYSIRWIPAGGFVRLPQMVTSEALEGASEEKYPPASPWCRIATAFAGPGMNLVFGFVLAVVLYFVLGFVSVVLLRVVLEGCAGT